MNEQQARKDMVWVHRMFYERGFSVLNDGNSAIRLGPNRILITPKGLDKSRLKSKDLTIIDLKGKAIQGAYKPSSEIHMHLEIFKSQAKAQAIVHAHPPYATSLSLANIELDHDMLPEVVIALGQVPTVPYTTTGTIQGAKIIAPYFKKHRVVILKRHGAVAIGSSIPEAFGHLERLEHTAKIIHLAYCVGRPTKLPKKEITVLKAISQKRG